MPFARTFDLFIDVAKTGGKPCLLIRKSGATDPETPSLMQGDVLTLRLFFREVLSGEFADSTATTIATGDVITLAAKKDVDQTDLLFSASSFTAGTDTTYGAYYAATLDLTTAELEAALDAAEDTLTVPVDIEVQNAANTRRSTFRFTVDVVQQVYAGETDPAPAEPSYPAPAAIMLKNPTGANYRVSAGGNFQLWNPTQSKWHTIWITGAAGAEQVTLGAGES